MANIINAITTGAGGLSTTADASGSIQIATNNGTTAMTIDTSQNVGIGTASPTAKLTVNGNQSFAEKTAAYIGVDIATTAGNGGNLTIKAGNGSGSGNTSGNLYVGAGRGSVSATSGFIAFGIAQATNAVGLDAEYMRIDSGGNVIINGTSSNHKLVVIDNNNRTEGTSQFSITGNGYSAYHFMDGTAYYIGQNSNVRELRMYSGSTTTTGVKLTAGATSWVSTSDENLKDIIEPITDAVNKVSTLRAVIGKYKTDEVGTRRPFLIAQDVEKVLPEAIHIGSDDTLNLSYTETIPLLVAAIKEQQTIINDLKARITALEGAA